MPDQNPFLEGSFAPVREEITAFGLPVTGNLPPELSGCYLRNGPNPMGLEDAGARWGEGHWFLGDGMVHGVRLRDGRAEWYRNRWVRSRRVAADLGEKWPGGPTHDDADFAANTHIIRHAGRVLATVEAGAAPTTSPTNWRPSARTTSTASSRAVTPRTRSWTGVPANCTPSPTTGPGLRAARVVDAAGEVSRTANIRSGRPMMHSR